MGAALAVGDGDASAVFGGEIAGAALRWIASQAPAANATIAAAE
jgi:hypothetical protein